MKWEYGQFESWMRIKYKNNVTSMFRNITVPFENIMGHCNYFFWSLWRILVILMSKVASKGVSSLINHTLYPYKLYYFSKFHRKHLNGNFLNVKSLIRLSKVIPNDVLWLDYSYWPIESISRIQNSEIWWFFAILLQIQRLIKKWCAQESTKTIQKCQVTCQLSPEFFLKV